MSAFIASGTPDIVRVRPRAALQEGAISQVYDGVRRRKGGLSHGEERMAICDVVQWFV